MGHSRPLFLYFHLLNTFDSKLMFNINFANDWIRTPVLLHWKRPLYQLSHIHCPTSQVNLYCPLELFPFLPLFDVLHLIDGSQTRRQETFPCRTSQHRSLWQRRYFFLNGHSQPLYVYFPLFNTNITTFTTNKCEKCTSSIRSWDSNPRPSEHKSPPITTRPGLPPNTCHKGQLGTRLFGSNVLVMQQMLLNFLWRKSTKLQKVTSAV